MKAPPHKYYRVLVTPQVPYTGPTFPELQEITGFNAGDYIEPVSENWGEILTLISDEAGSESQLSSSLIILPYGPKIYQPYEQSLEILTRAYGLKNIHFSELFGRKKLLKNRLPSFLEKYIEIVSKIPMACLSISTNKQKLIQSFGGGRYSNEELFHSLFAANFSRVAGIFPPRTIFHIYREQEQAFSEKMFIREFEKLLSVIASIATAKNTPQSVCRHPHIFSKQALLYSSLSDLVAYTSNKIQLKIDAGISSKKIENEYGPLLFTVKSVFANRSGLASEELRYLVDNARATA